MSSVARTRLSDLPEDVLLAICDFAQPEALHALASTCPFWASLCVNRAWPRRLAAVLGVQSICIVPDASAVNRQQTRPLDSETWLRAFHTFVTYPSSRTLCICVMLSKADTVTSLALEYAVSRQDIFRTNSLFSEHHVASRTHLYVPLLTEASVLHFTGKSTKQHTPLLLRDTLLSNKYFLVVKFKPCTDPKPEFQPSQTGRQSYVRQLIVKLIAKGLSVDQDEVWFYLDDNNFDVATAYKQLLRDHNFCP